MNSLVNIFKENSKFIELSNELEDRLKKLQRDKKNNIKFELDPISILGLTDMGKSYYSMTLALSTNHPICIITYNEIQAKKMIKDLSYFVENSDEEIYFLNKKDIVTYDYAVESKDSWFERIDTLNALKMHKAKVLVTTIEAVMQNIIDNNILYKDVLHFEIGKEYSIEKIKQKLLNLGYERCDLIEGRGQFAIRGGIIDIATNESMGVRIELWGDEIDSIRYFNIMSQRSKDNVESVEIYPAHEYILNRDLDEVCNDIVKKYLNNVEKKSEAYINRVNQDIEKIKNDEYLSKIDKYFDCFYKKTTNIFEYLSKDTIILFDEPTKIEARSNNIIADNKILMETLSTKDKIIPNGIEKELKYNEVLDTIDLPVIYLEKQDISNKTNISYKFNFREVIYSKNSLDSLIDEINIGINKNKKIVILGGTTETIKKILNLIVQNDIPYKRMEKFNLKALDSGKVYVTTGAFSAGFECYDLDLLVITGEELFIQSKPRKKRVNSAFAQGENVVFADLKVGDLIVHKNYGIGQFIGVNTIEADGTIKDYIKLKYYNDDILYIPTNALDNIRKYIGGGEATLKLNKLGSKDWSNTKAKVKSNLRKVAKELIELYARREKIKGYAFSPDTIWQKQFEDDFPYVETEDQLRCIEEVKKDMEKSKPMDRLLCGDVGYGKTEVAIRAAFKAVMDQKQVAYLVPTTVLAQQQYESFKERMQNFPIKVEVLNRFKTKKEQSEIIKKLKTGEIDIIVGTHRILSKDVDFKNLGLLIIDEEHRFGVKAKEKIKELKTSIDVLTMTATPIPRTLHMSVVGIRDMSVIYEPPQDRKPVQTYVLEYDDEVIKEAITRELERDGQVFYLYNSVEWIEQKAMQIQNLVPEAKVGFAHGRMTGTEIENIMQDFIDKKINVLVCTTILESGIDIPNANTIIVENADRLGLAQLYQIRGRVGRSNIQAYAYITYKRDKMLSEVADKRLKAIKEFTEFGSGFKIAIRDLEIRGAGSLLGELQHGHMEQVGYDTYCKLLEEVVLEEKGITVEEETDVQIDINISSYIPDSYIKNSSQKIEIYQDIALCRTEEDIRNVIDEVIDRYGNMPSEMENLLDIARIKNLCKKVGIIKLIQKGKQLIYYFKLDKFNQDIFANLMKVYSKKLKFSPGKVPYITYKLETYNEKDIIKEVVDFLKNAKKKE